MGVGWHAHRLDYEFVGLHGTENEVGAAGIESDDYSFIEAVHLSNRY